MVLTLVRRLLFLAILCLPTALASQPVPDARIRAVMDRPEFAHASWGLEFYDLDAKKVVAALG